MSVNLYPIALRWEGQTDKHHPGRGVLKVGGITVDLTSAPGDFAGVDRISFHPSIQDFRVRRDCVHEPEDLRPPEIQQLYGLMNRIAVAVLRELNRNTREDPVK